MKNTILIFSLLIIGCFSTFSQVGIGNTDPKATLDVKGEPTNTAEFDGLIVPILSASQLNDKVDYTAAQDGAIVYVPFGSLLPGSPKAQIAQVAEGLNVFDGANLVWRSISASGKQKTLKLPAEYAGAVVVSAGAGIGDLSGDYNSTENVYRWETIETTDQIVDISVQIPLPDDFNAWTGFPNLTLSGSNAVIQSVDNATAAGTGTTSVTLSGSNNPGDVIRVVIRLTANAGTAEAGLLTLSYN